ncbi:MAG: glucokinase [Gammaproteobacteria bacterium]|nr:glucokinase [Gammaproteobacteria bacterium]
MKVLAGDVGGTKTLLSIAECTGHCEIVYEHRFISTDYPGLAPMLTDFLQAAGGSADKSLASACFAVAGPITNAYPGQQVHVTNLPWVLESKQLAAFLGIKAVRLVNDFQSIGYGIEEALEQNGFISLQTGRQQAGGTRAFIGAGTGLGGGIMVWDQDHYTVLPSEEGHTGFAPEDAEQRALLDYLSQRQERVSYDDILSGPGLLRIYNFLRDTSTMPTSVKLEEAIKNGDPAAAISRFGLSGEDRLADQALDLFVRIYGAQAGNLALTCLAVGGVFIAGGIAPKIISRLTNGLFIQAFRAKGPMERLLKTMPVSVINNERVGLLGAVVLAGRGGDVL